jgi:hypothetical protein
MTPSNSAPAVRAGSAQRQDIELQVRNQDVCVTIDVRHYRIRGLERNFSPHQLRVNILATRDGLVHMDTLDLCKASSRASFVKATAGELYCDQEVIKKDVGRILLELERLQADQIEAATRAQVTQVELSACEREQALEFLQSTQLLERIVADYALCGLVGEETNKLVCYLAAVSRRLEQPLSILIQSGSAAGKTALMDATLAFVPPEDQVRYSALTGQSLYYMGKGRLKHKILAIAGKRESRRPAMWPAIENLIHEL